jgi:hypothetical protein
MAAEPRRAPMMSLQQLVANYRTLAGEFGKPVAISAFALTTEETERLFSGYDEDTTSAASTISPSPPARTTPSTASPLRTSPSTPKSKPFFK